MRYIYKAVLEVTQYRIYAFIPLEFLVCLT